MTVHTHLSHAYGRMIPTPMLMAMVAPVASESRRSIVSRGSSSSSSTSTLTLTVCSVCPGANTTVPVPAT